MLVILVLLYLFMIFIRPHEYIEVLQNVSIPMYLLLFSAVVWWFSADRQKMDRVPQTKAIFIFLFLILVSNVFGGWGTKGVTEATKFLPVVLLFLIIISGFNSEEKIHKAIKLIVFCAVIISIHGFFQKQDGVGWTGVELYQNRIRYVGIFNDPNDLGVLLVIAVPMVLYCYAAVKNKLIKLYYLSSLLIVIVGIYLTNSRGSILSLIAMAMFYIKERFGKKYVIYMSLLLSPLLLLAPSRMSQVSASEESAAGRIYAWYQGLQMLFSNPASGIGAGRFTDYHVITAHNSFILIMAEMGVFGYWMWLLMFVLSFFMVSSIRKKSYINLNVPFNSTRLKSQTMMFYYGFIGMFTSIFFLSRSYLVLLYVFVALALANYTFVDTKLLDVKERYSISNIWMKYLGYSVVSIIGFYIVVKVLLSLV